MANRNGNAWRSSELRACIFGVIGMDRVPKEAFRSPRMGQHRFGRDAEEHLQESFRFLESRYPRTGLRLGGNRSGFGSLQQASHRQESQLARRGHGGFGL